jgi:hypothetical protein
LLNPLHRQPANRSSQRSSYSSGLLLILCWRERTSMKSHSEESGQYYGGVHAPSNTPASHRNVRDFSRPHGSLHVPASAYPLRLCPELDRAYQPGHQRNRHLRATHREQGRRPSKPSEIFGAEKHANVNPQAAPSDSEAPESSQRYRRTYSARLLAYQLRAITFIVTTT